jgi:hypothetical protein
MLVAYAHAFPDFTLHLFVAPFPNVTYSQTHLGIVSMGGLEEGTRTMMEVDSIVAKVATKSSQVAPHTIETTTKTMHPSTLATIVEINKVTENLH